MGMEQAWLLPAIPLAAFVILLLAGPYLPRRGDWLAIAAIAASFILFFPVLADLLVPPDRVLVGAALSGGGGQESVHHHAHWRRRLSDRHHLALARRWHVQHP